MYTSTLLSVILVATLVSATPVPLTVGYDTEPTEGDAHAATIAKAATDANTQIQNMRATLADPTNPVNQQRIHDAFGPNANLAEIGKTVDRLHTGNLQVTTADPTVFDTAAGKAKLAKVSLNKNPDGTFHSMGSALIGSRFHKTTFSDKQRAGTLIHEATHQQSRTGDDVITQGQLTQNIIVPAGVKPAGPAAQGIQKEGGYARSDTKDINSAADLSQEYKTLRDASPNMHQNADSYRVFGALCSRSLYKRALIQDDPVGYYLERRSQCSLPKDYFAKKATEKKAAAAKGTTASKTATNAIGAEAKTGISKTATDKGVKSKTATTKAKGLMTQKAGKAGKVGKVVKGAKAVGGTRKVGKATGAKSARKQITKSTKAAKGVKAAKGAKSVKTIKGPKTSKAVKATKSAKPLKSVKGVKVSKATKGLKAAKGQRTAKATKGAKSTKLSKSTNDSKAFKGTKAAKGVKALKGAKTAKGAKVVKGAKATKSTNRSKATKTVKGGKSMKTSKTTKAAKGVKAVKGVKAAKTVKGAKPIKANKALKSTKSTKSMTSKASNKTTGKSNKVKATKAPTKAKASRGSQKVNKVAPKAVKAVAPKAAKIITKAVPVAKKGGKKNRRDLEFVLDELD